MSTAPPHSNSVLNQQQSHQQQSPWLNLYPKHVSPHLEYPSFALPGLLEHAAKAWPDRACCVYYSETVSYQEQLDRAKKVAIWLREQGIQQGDRVGILMPNLPEYLPILFGIWMAGGTAVALSPLFVADEAVSFIESTQCRIVFTLDVLTPLVSLPDFHPEIVVTTTLATRLDRLERLGYAWIKLLKLGWKGAAPHGEKVDLQTIFAPNIDVDVLYQPITISPLNRAYILPTGGTTSAPKAVTLSHQNLVSNAWQVFHWINARPGGESILAVLPFFHSYGLTTCLLTGVTAGATLILHHRFRAESVLKLIDKHQPTLFPAVPAMLAALNQLLEKKSRKFDSIRAVISGGAALPEKVAEKFSKLTGADVVEGYGLSEASPVTHAGPLDGRKTVMGTIGYPLPDTDARIVDAETGTHQLKNGEVGELIVKGPQVMMGYWNDSISTHKIIRDGWLYTGDLATCEEDGYFRIVDRKKDLIITSGFNVYPADVESVIAGYTAVKEVAVVGVNDEIRGETVKAVLVLKDGFQFNRDDFQQFIQSRLSAHKRPRIVEVREEPLPRNFLGKVLRRELRDGHSPESLKTLKS